MKVPAVTLWVPTFSPTWRTSVAAVLVSALSFTDTAPFHVEIAGLFTSPVSVTPTVASAGSSEPYTFVWFGLVNTPVNVAVVIARFGVLPSPSAVVL